MGGFIRKIFKIEQPVFEQPQPIDEVPKVMDEVREDDIKEEIETKEKKRKGRRSTILTSNQGLLDIKDEDLKKPILGG